MELSRGMRAATSPARRAQRGMSLIELMIAMVVLAVGMGAIMGLFVMAISNNSRNKIDTGGTLVAQVTLEQIVAVPANQPIVILITDCAGNDHRVSTANGGPALDANGNVNFNIAPIAGYRMLYVTCGAGGQRVTYDVRWRVERPSAFTKLVTVSSRQLGAEQAGASARLFAMPTTLRTIGGI
jgi:prepilin-type N-terminal cleavage/methylation domain-containing protein